jgi:hypothetical protein
MGLWEAMQHKQGGSRAADTSRHMGMNVRAVDLKTPNLKVVKPMHNYTFNSKQAII